MTPESRDTLTALLTQISWDPEGMITRLNASPAKNRASGVLIRASVAQERGEVCHILCLVG